VPGHTIPSIKDGEDGIKKGYPPLPHKGYEDFINTRMTTDRHRLFDGVKSIRAEENLDDFFNALSRRSRDFGERYRKVDNPNDPDIYGYLLWMRAEVYDRINDETIKAATAYYRISEVMVPLAVEYTAGLIKYFLDLEATTPPETTLTQYQRVESAY
jgi:hypothetical protein